MNIGTTFFHKNNLMLYLLCGIFIVALIFFLPITYLLHYTQDDAFFYIKIAQNIASGYGSTFDTINETNGYHPLWLLLLTGVFLPLNAITTPTPELLFRITFLVTTVINFVTITFFRELLNHFYPEMNVKVIYSAIILLSVTVLFNTIGLEIQLVIFLLVGYILLLSKRLNVQLRIFLTGLLCVARIDLLFFIMPVIFFVEYRENRYTLSLKELLSYFVFPAILIATYYLFNYFYFGSFISTSASVEFRPDLNLFSTNIPLPHTQPIRFMLFSYSLLGGFLFIIRKGMSFNSLRNSFFIFWLTSIIYLFVHFVFNLNGARDWYYGVPAFFSTIFIVSWLDEQKIFRLPVFFISLMVLFLYITLFRINYLNYDDAYYFALSVRKNTKPSDKIFMIDMSGFLGFFSERIVINGDGLVNSHSYLKAIREKNLQNYFFNTGITHYATYTYTNPFDNNIFTEKNYQWFPYNFVFTKNDLVISAPKVHGGIFRKKFGQFLIFRMDGNK